MTFHNDLTDGYDSPSPKTGKCCISCYWEESCSAAPRCSNLRCDCHSEPFDYERDHSHYHCWDTTEGDEGINGQEGHEKHLACCICRKRPESKTGKCCRKCNPGANGNYQAGMGGCFDPECDCHKPEAKTSDEVVEEAVEDFKVRSVSEEGDEVIDWLRSTLTALVARVRGEEGVLNAELLQKYLDKGKKEGALAVLADLEESVNRILHIHPCNPDHVPAISVHKCIASLRASVERK